MSNIIPFGKKDEVIKEASEQLYATNEQISLKERNGAEITDADIDRYFGAAADLLNAQDEYEVRKKIRKKNKK